MDVWVLIPTFGKPQLQPVKIAQLVITPASINAVVILHHVKQNPKKAAALAMAPWVCLTLTHAQVPKLSSSRCLIHHTTHHHAIPIQLFTGASTVLVCKVIRGLTSSLHAWPSLQIHIITQSRNVTRHLLLLQNLKLLVAASCMA